jgi:hypothetical protein
VTVANRLTRPTRSKVSFVATKTTTVRNEYDRDETVKAGQTYIHDAGHFLVVSYPELFRRVGSPLKPRARRRSAPAATARKLAPSPMVVLLESATPTLTVRLRDDARVEIRDAGFWARDGLKRGGGLFGVAHGRNPSELVVKRACGPGPRSRAGTHRFESDIDDYVRQENGPGGVGGRLALPPRRPISQDFTRAELDAGAEELYHQASRGRPWSQAPNEVRQEFRGIVRRILGAAHTADLAEQSRQREGRGWRLPGSRA